MRKFKQSFILFSLLMFFCAGVFGIVLGLLLANTVNTKNIENFTEFTTALPTRLLDINGELITEFSSDEKRELITIDKLPTHMLNALLTREDRTFYRHRGYSVKALTRAVIGQLSGKDRGGGSTLTQQIAGTLYCDRSDKSVKRKIKELWWAIQMERRYSKNDILELYLNKIYLGGGTYGVNAASKYYFGHPASEITPAEAAILVIQLSNPAAYNPFEHPSTAQDRQKYVLDEMVSLGYLTQEEATDTFDDYWATFDYTRTGTSAFFMREDKAPWFSEYVLRELNSLIYGKADIYTGGFTVNTTMNMKHQLAAQDIMTRTLEYANNTYRKSSGSRSSDAVSTYIPMVEMLSLLFDIPKLKVGQERAELVTRSTFEDQINPVLDIFSLICGIDSLKTEVINRTNAKQKQDSSKTTIEGAFISLENETGYITALVGGSKFDAENQFIRATQALVQPGSTFKPLYYSAAIDSKKFTATTQIDDSPVIFYNEDNIPYIPNNFKGEWLGTVQLWYALAKSMNIPSLKIFDGVGFDAAFDRAAALLGIPKEEFNSRHFDRVYPSALGICSIRPIELARAFAIFANQGKAVTPFAIRSVEDRNGKVFENPEARIRAEQKKLGSNIQVISPQTAYIMTDILTNSVRMGTLAYGVQWGAKLQYKNSNGQRYQMPAAGKTGTTQNWTNAWAVGYTPYYTAALWFGFDQPGQSLGLELTGSTLAGPAWGDFMRIANEDMPYKEFAMPQTGLVKATVCSVSGKLLTAECGDHTTTKYYLEGTQPTTVCDYHKNREAAKTLATSRLETERYMAGIQPQEGIIDDSPLEVDLSFLDENYTSEEEQQQQEEDSFSWGDLFSFGSKKKDKNKNEQQNQNESVEPETDNSEEGGFDPFGMNDHNEPEKSDQPENFLFD